MIKRRDESYSDIDAVDILHKVANMYTSTKIPHDYGTGEEYTSVEVHTLKEIADNQGITATELAKNHGTTKGAISQILKKVEGKGLICRQVDPDNDNRYHLFLTEKGKNLDEAHRRYDQISFGESMSMVREQFDEEEINIAFSVLESWLTVRRDVQLRRLIREKEKKKEKKRKN